MTSQRYNVNQYLPWRGRTRDLPYNLLQPYLAETLAYKTRVEAAGGSIVLLSDVNSALKWAIDNSLYDYVEIWAGAQFGVTKDGSDLVSALFDISSHNIDAAAAGTNRPTWIANQKNGKAGLSFNGTSNGMTHAWAGSGDTTMVAVALGDAGGQSGYVSVWCASNGGATLKMPYGRLAGSANWGTYMGVEKPSSYSLYGTWRMIMMLDDGVSANPCNTYFYTDNQAMETVSHTGRYSDANARKAIGMSSAADGYQYFKGIITEVIGFSKQLSAGEVASLKTHLNSRWAIY